MPDASAPEYDDAATRQGDAATRQGDADEAGASLDETEADPYATVVPGPAHLDATAAGASLDATGAGASLDETEADPYATRPVESALAESALATTHPWQGAGKAPWPSSPGPVRYQPIRLHARGGLGEVYVAVDGELNREVALKEIQEQYGDRPDSRFRFLFEAEVTGGLEHPGIVPVYGLGQYADGRPYYAMRFIRGDTLKSAIKRLHNPAGAKPGALRHSLEFRQLLGRFVDVCHAIDYAHSRGVVHRDIKPDNVMLGPHGETLVVDWGLAKAVDRPEPADGAGPGPLRPVSGTDGSMTLHGSVVGTPSYMSPEQAAGEVDDLGPSADIFSLGTTLYDLLTGHAPFRGKALTEIIENVRNAQYPPARKVNPGVPPALEAICHKAMSLRPADRYPSAAALATDLDRWMADEPVAAYREPFTARAARWGRRHRTAVAVGLALLVTISAALGISNVLVGRERARAERNFRRARSAVEQMLTKVGEVDLADVPQMEPVRRDLLARALGFYQDFLAERGVDAWSRLEAGRASGRLGDVRELMGLYAQAEADYRRAIGLLEGPASDPSADPEARRALARFRNNLGVLFKKSNRFAEAEALLRSALADRAAMAASALADEDDRRAVAATRYQLGALLSRLPGRGPEDEAAYRSAIADQEALIARPASRPEDRRDLARYLNNLGILQSGADPAAAEASFRRALAIQDDLEAGSAGNAGFRWQRARTRSNLATLLFRTGRPEEAAPLFAQGREGLERLAADFPTVPDYRRELAILLNNFGLLREALPGDGPAPVDLFRRALADQRDLARTFPEVPDHRLKLAVTCLHLGDLLRPTEPTEAARFLAEAVGLKSRLVAEYPDVPEYQADYGRALTERALLVAGQGKPAEALTLLDPAIRALERALRGNPRDRQALGFLVQASHDRAQALLALGRTSELAAEAARLASLMPDRPEGHLFAARFLARCVELAGRDPAQSEAARQSRAGAYAGDAVKALRKAIEKGQDGPSALDDPALAPLRGRPEFERLREEVKAGGPRKAVV